MRHRARLQATFKSFMKSTGGRHNVPSCMCNFGSPKSPRLDTHTLASIVRTGPTHVSVSDPAQIPVIYGISSKFTKVSSEAKYFILCCADHRVVIFL